MRENLCSMISMMRDENFKTQLTDHILDISSSECGISVPFSLLLDESMRIVGEIDDLVIREEDVMFEENCSDNQPSYVQSTMSNRNRDIGDLIPFSFWERNEFKITSNINSNSPQLIKAFSDLDLSAKELCETGFLKERID